MPRLAAPPTFQPNSSPLAAADSALTATIDQRVVVPSIKKRRHVLPDVAPSWHASRSTFLRKPQDQQARSLSEHALEKSSKPEKLAQFQSRAPLPPTPYLRWNYQSNKRARTMWAHRWEARHDITYKNTPWESRRYSIPVNTNLCRLDPRAEVVTSLILYGTPREPELKLRLKKDKGSGKGGSSTWKAETPWDDDLRNDRYLRKLRREQAAILEQVNAISSSRKTNVGRKGKTSAKGERQLKWHYNW